VAELIVKCHVCICAHRSVPAGEEHEGRCGYITGTFNGIVNGVPEGQVHDIIVIDGMTNRGLFSASSLYLLASLSQVRGC